MKKFILLFIRWIEIFFFFFQMMLKVFAQLKI